MEVNHFRYCPAMDLYIFSHFQEKVSLMMGKQGIYNIMSIETILLLCFSRTFYLVSPYSYGPSCLRFLTT